MNRRRDALVDALVAAKQLAVATAAYEKAQLALTAAQTRLKQIMEEDDHEGKNIVGDIS